MDSRKNLWNLNHMTEIYRIYYHPSTNSEPCTDFGICIAFSSWAEPHISSHVDDSSSVLRTIRSFEPEGEGTIVDTPSISTGKGDHWKSIDWLLVFTTWADRINFLFLLATKFVWLIENIALELPTADSFPERRNK